MNNHSYEFEAGMRVECSGRYGLVYEVRRSEPALSIDLDNGKRGQWNTHEVAADSSHPGTRGLLLDQYRKVSGHEHATTLFSDGVWYVDPDATNCSDRFAGRGSTEGLAILDALTRLTDKRATIEPLPEPQAPIVAYFDHDGRRHRVVVRSGPEPHVAIEWLAAPDALGNERWNSVDTDIENWDGHRWCEYVALALAKHRAAMRVPADLVTPPEPPDHEAVPRAVQGALGAHADAVADIRDRLADIDARERRIENHAALS